MIRSLPAVAIGWSAIASGLIAWRQRPANRLGPLMAAYGLAVLVRPWQYSSDALVFTIGYAAQPAQRRALRARRPGLSDRADHRPARALARPRSRYAFALLLPTRDPARLRRQRAALHPPGAESLLLVHADHDLALNLDRPSCSPATGSSLRASSRSSSASSCGRHRGCAGSSRRCCSPRSLAALRAVTEFVVHVRQPGARVHLDDLYWWQVAGQILPPVALLVGLLRARLARAQVGDLAARAGPHPAGRDP